MDCSMSASLSFTISQEFAQTHVHWVGDAIQPSHPLSSPSPPAFNLSQHEGLYSMSRRFTSGGQSTEASASVFPMNVQGWFPLELTGLISLLSKGLSRIFSSTTVWRHQFFAAQPFLWSTSHNHAWLLVKPSVQLSCSVLSDSLQSHGPDILHIRCQNIGKTITLTVWTFVGNVMSLLFNTLSRFVITFLPRSKHLLISWLQSPSAGILEPKKIKSLTVFHCFPIYLPWSDRTRCQDLSVLNAEF